MNNKLSYAYFSFNFKKMLLRNFTFNYKLRQNFIIKKFVNSKMERRQPYDFILVLDFEATCEKNTKLHPQVSWPST